MQDTQYKVRNRVKETLETKKVGSSHSFIHSFVHSGDLYSASSRDYYSEATL